MTESLGLPDGGRGGALAGVVIVELAETLAGELAGGLLADLGATVIKIEPRGGSPMRRRGPGIAGEDSLAFQSENRGKHSVQAELAELGTEPWLARLLAAADALVEDLGPGRLEAAGLSPDDARAAEPAPGHPAHLAVRADRAAGRRARRRSDRAGLLGRAVRDADFRTAPPMPVTVPLAECWTAHPRRERAPHGDLSRAAQRPRTGRRHRPLPDRPAHAGRRRRPPRPDGGGDGAPGHRVAHRGPRERLPDAGRRLDRGLRRGRPALRPPLRGDRGPRRAEGSPLRHPRRAAAASSGVGRAGRVLDRHARPGRRRGALRRRRRGRHRGALRRRHHRRRAREGARGHAASHVGDRPGVPRARAGAEALADAGARTRGAPRRSASTPRRSGRRSSGSRPGPESTRRTTRPRRAPPDPRARCAGSACSTSRNGWPARRRRPCSATSAPT